MGPQPLPPWDPAALKAARALGCTSDWNNGCRNQGTLHAEAGNPGGKLWASQVLTPEQMPELRQKIAAESPRNAAASAPRRRNSAMTATSVATSTSEMAAVARSNAITPARSRAAYARTARAARQHSEGARSILEARGDHNLASASFFALPVFGLVSRTLPETEWQPWRSGTAAM